VAVTVWPGLALAGVTVSDFRVIEGDAAIVGCAMSAPNVIAVAILSADRFIECPLDVSVMRVGVMLSTVSLNS
jgi:hypothetical protein